jgi:hypothetical protein
VYAIVFMVLLEDGKGLGTCTCVMAAFCGLYCFACLYGCVRNYKLLALYGNGNGVKEGTYANKMEVKYICLLCWMSQGRELR